VQGIDRDRRKQNLVSCMARMAETMGARLIACETALKGEGLARAALAQGVEVAGLATFLEAVGAGQIVAF